MEIQDVNFRTQIAEELSRTELIDRLCEYHETIIKLKDFISSYYDDDDDDFILLSDISELEFNDEEKDFD